MKRKTQAVHALHLEGRKKKKKKKVKPLGFAPPEGAYNNQKHLKIWESALFRG